MSVNNASDSFILKQADTICFSSVEQFETSRHEYNTIEKAENQTFFLQACPEPRINNID